jgi:hypothetical protein
LSRLDSHIFQTSFTEHDIICLFCVEQFHSACHRSLVAQKLHKDLHIPIIHIY